MTKQFLIFWGGDKKAQLVEGATVAAAFNNAGIGAGALPAVDWHEPLTPPKHFPKAQFIEAFRLEIAGLPKDVNASTIDGRPVSSLQLWRNEHNIVIAIVK